MPAGDITEKSSLSNYRNALCTHIDLVYRVNFDTKKLYGKGSYTVKVLEDGVTEVLLDTKDLEVTSASVAGVTAQWSFGDIIQPFGRALRIPLDGLVAGNVVVVSVEWLTTEASTALQWLTPEQTSGPHPYLFSQNQAIHARTMLPCQDTPMVKCTYSAHVIVPEPLVAVMSAQRVEQGSDAAGSETPPADAGCKVFSFRQPVPIPSYLISLAVGQLESRSVGTRTRVWAEPSVINDAAWEFADMEQFVAAAEARVGPYVWGTYEVLVCPKSYPYGGMEHPVVTNITPTLLAGDRSLVDVIAHECAHSWTGNLVTNATWESFWLNEGFTMMLERKICSTVFGPSTYDFDAASGAFALGASIRDFMDQGEGGFTKLVPDLTGIDPDDAFSSVPYEKGFALLHSLQTLVGVAAFDAFLHDYIQTYKFKTVTSEQFKAYAIAYFGQGRHTLPRVGHTGVPPVHSGSTGGVPTPDEIAALATPNTGALDVPDAGVSAEKAAAAATHAIDVAGFPWDAWFYAPGLPPTENVYDRSQRDAVEALADLWVDGSIAAAKEASGPITAGWSPSAWIAFLERLSSRSTTLASASPPATLHSALLQSMDEAYGFTASKNAEIRLHWYTLSLRSGVQERVKDVLSFLKAQGRMKYVRPLFRELLRTTFGRPEALALFETVKSAYHPICSKMVGADIVRETAKVAVDPKALVQVGGAVIAAVQIVAESQVEAEAPAPEAEDEAEDDDDEEDEDEGEAAAKPRRRGLITAQARAKARLGQVRPANPLPRTQDEEGDDDEDDGGDEMEEGGPAGGEAAHVGEITPFKTPAKGTPSAAASTPAGLSSPASSVAEAEARLRAAEARRREMLAASPLKPMSAAERSRDPAAAAARAAAARKAAAAGELIREDDIESGGLASSFIGGAGTAVIESLESVQVSSTMATAVSTVLAAAAVGALALGAVYLLRGRRR